jgi:hypothetical protein
MTYGFIDLQMTFPFKAPWLVRGFPTFDRSMRTRSPQKAWPTTRSGLGSRALFFDLFGGCYKVVKVVAKKIISFSSCGLSNESLHFGNGKASMWVSWCLMWSTLRRDALDSSDSCLQALIIIRLLLGSQNHQFPDFQTTNPNHHVGTNWLNTPMGCVSTWLSLDLGKYQLYWSETQGASANLHTIYFCLKIRYPQNLLVYDKQFPMKYAYFLHVETGPKKNVISRGLGWCGPRDRAADYSPHGLLWVALGLGVSPHCGADPGMKLINGNKWWKSVGILWDIVDLVD